MRINIILLCIPNWQRVSLNSRARRWIRKSSRDRLCRIRLGNRGGGWKGLRWGRSRGHKRRRALAARSEGRGDDVLRSKLCLCRVHGAGTVAAIFELRFRSTRHRLGCLVVCPSAEAVERLEADSGAYGRRESTLAASSAPAFSGYCGRRYVQVGRTKQPWSRPYFALCECPLYCHELIHKLEVLPGTSPPGPSCFHSTIPPCHPAMYGPINCPILVTANNPSFPSSLHNYTYLLPLRFWPSPIMDNLYKQAAEALQPATASPCTYALLNTSLVTFNPLQTHLAFLSEATGRRARATVHHDSNRIFRTRRSCSQSPTNRRPLNEKQNFRCSRPAAHLIPQCCDPETAPLRIRSQGNQKACIVLG